MTGPLRVVVPLGMPEAMRVLLIRASHEQSRELRVEELERPDPLDHLEEPFDLMFHFGEPPKGGEWVSRVLARVPLVPVASEAYLAEHGRPASPDDLASHRVLAWRIGRAIPTVWPLRAGGAIDVDPIFCSRNPQLLHRLAQEGMGILLGDPNPMLLSTPTPLVPILDDVIGMEITVRYLAPPTLSTDPRTRAILEPIRAMLDGLSPERRR